MRYIFTALKPEAQALVDKYKLQKIKINNYTLFINTNMIVIITGLGVLNSIKACNFIVDNYTIEKNDSFINIGICGAKKNHAIGGLLEIGVINYNSESFIINKNIKQTITCLENEATDDLYELVDMESYGFYKILNHYQNIFMFKVVSDHFEPETITKEKTKKLIFNNLDEILKKVN